MQYPVKFIYVSNPFKNGSHYGTDFGYKSKADPKSIEGKNMPIYATADGKVIYKYTQTSGGKVLHIRHNNGFVSEYAHLDTWLVNKGDTVSKGQQVGTMGATGKVKGNHLHFGLYKGTSINYNDKSKFVDPVLYISKDDYETMYVYNTDWEGLNVRETPNGRLLTTIPVGTELKVYEQNGNWFRTDKGFVYGKYLSNTKPNVKSVTSDSLNIRKSYSSLSKLIGNIKKGTKVQVFKTFLGWSKISPTENAWVSSKYIK